MAEDQTGLDSAIQNNGQDPAAHNPAPGAAQGEKANENVALGNHRSGVAVPGSLRTISRPTPNVIKAGSRVRLPKGK